MNKKRKNYKAEFNKAVRSLNKRDDALSRAIVGLDKRMEGSFKSTHYRIDSLENRINGLEKRMDERFDRLESHIDAFMKRTETNEREIQFLGKQHDDLAGYCTKKIGYPAYGRNL